MRWITRSALVPVSLLVAVASAADIVYVTELSIYSALAPCAASALYYNVQRQTYDACPTPASDLQGCVCTKNRNLASIASAISSSVSYSCGSQAVDDQASASTVLSAYCNQDRVIAFPTPVTPVDVYVTDVPEYQNLAPCAASALYYAVGHMTYSACPTDATALATCACLKNQNSASINSMIASTAKSSCSGMAADVTSAQAMFAAYCNLNNGTSNFPQPTNPPGDMSYYITDLPAYTSLAPCAAYGVSYAVQGQTYYLCPKGSQELASCACFKDGMTGRILSSVTASVKYSCGSTATDDISSAVAVYNLYCSAAGAKVTAQGVTASVSQTRQTPTGGTGPKSTSKGGGTGSGAGTGGGSNGGGSSGGSGNNNVNGDSDASTNGSGLSDPANKNTGPNIGLVAGGAIGGVVALAAIGILIFFLVKKSQKRKAAAHQVLPDTSTPDNGGYDGKHELASDSIAAPLAGPLPPPSPSPSTLKVGPHRGDNVSPVSAHASVYSPPPNKAELSGAAPPPPMPNELQAQGVYPPTPNSAELYGQQRPAYPPAPNSAELYGQQRPPYSPAPNSAELYGGQQQRPMYPPSPNTAELYAQGGQFPQGQGSPYPPPNRPELMGGYYQPQKPQVQEFPGYNSYQGQQPQQQPVELQPVSWQSGPVPGVHIHEMDTSQNHPGHAR
ncbi:hypothetical protein B0H63DRAFT_205877 [Podospora didyma]|uniref:Uncharacterized protein n=1 Tax=Podospora didyma TaxID=330526 RepID=A0AAE0NHC8_9PEZI|nr:hypothetical protein B0H63DRAFT_205877 [Podospora didyma]